MKPEDVKPGMEIEIPRKGMATRLTVDKIEKITPYGDVYAFYTHEHESVYVDGSYTITLLSEPPDPQKFGLRAILNNQRYVCVQAFDLQDGLNSLWKSDDGTTDFYSWSDMLAMGGVELVEDEEQWFNRS